MSKRLVLAILLVFYAIYNANSQKIESIVFSSGASNNNNFQALLGLPFNAYLKTNSSSLSISSEYGNNTIKETELIVGDVFNNQNGALLFPNPTENIMTVDLTALMEETYTLMILNVMGEKVKEKILIGKKEIIDMGDYESGIYFVRISSPKNNLSSTYKVLKIR